MPVLNAGDLAQIRSRPIGRRFKLYVHQPETQWTGVVAGAPTRGDRVLTVTTVTGVGGNIRVDCTVRVTDAAGDPKSSPSKVRFRSYAAGPTEMTVGDNDIDWAVGDLLTAQNLWELWPRFVYADVTDPENPVWYKDRDVAYVDEDTAFAPKSNPGPAAIGMLSGGVCDLVFDGQHSFSSPTGVPVIGWQWITIGGAPAVVAGNPLGVTVTFRYTTPGFYYVALTVTDANAITDVCYVPVIVDDGTLAIDYSYPGDRGTSGSGWSMSRNLPGIDMDESLFYDGAPTFLVADDRQVADTQFIPNRSNLRFSGWLIEDDVERSKYGRLGRYRAVTSDHILRGIPAYPTGLRIDAAPTEWDYATTWNLDAACCYIFRWQSTVSRVCNFYATGEWALRQLPDPTGTESLQGGADLISNSLLEQVDWLLGGVAANLRCSRQNGLRSSRHEWTLSAAEEAARNTVMTLTNVDWQSARYGTRPHKATVREFSVAGLDSAAAPYLAGSPGEAPLEGGRPDEKNDFLVTSQNELNRWAGQFLAIRNFNIPLVLTMSGEYDVVDPSYGEYVTAALNNYDPKLPNGPYSITGVRFREDHKNGYNISEWTLLPDPSAFGGYGSKTIDIPVIPPPPPPPPINGPPPPPPIEEVDWPSMVYFCGRGAGVGANNGGVWVTEGFTPPSESTQPTWVKLNVTGDWPADNYIKSFGIDVSEPDEYVYALTRNILSTAGIDVIRYSATAGTWATILSQATVQIDYGGSAFIHDFMIDKVTGYANALVTVDKGGGDVDFHVLYRCLDPTAGVPVWGQIAATGTKYYARGFGNLWVYNDQATYTYTSDSAGFDHYISVSSGGGAWDRVALHASANVATRHLCNRGSIDVYHTWSDSEHMGFYQIGGGAYSAAKVCSAAVPTTCYNRSATPSVFMPDPTDANSLRFVPNRAPNAGHLFTTSDKFQTYTDQGYLDIGLVAAVPRVVNSIAERVSDDYTDAILYGSSDAAAGNEHSLFAAEGDTDITPEGKSGAHPDTGVDSIHYLADGPCWRGIQAVPGT